MAPALRIIWLICVVYTLSEKLWALSEAVCYHNHYMVHVAADSEVVAQPLAELSWAATVVEGGSEPQWAQKAYTATGAALGIAAVCAFRGEQDHGTDHWEQLARLAATSAGHPVIGNLATAGCAALLVGKLGSERLRTSHFGQNALK